MYIINNKVLIKGGQLEFTQGNIFDLNKDPYLKISNSVTGANFASSTIEAKQAVEMSIKGYGSDFISSVGLSKFLGISIGRSNAKTWNPTHVGGAQVGVLVRGGTAMSDLMKSSPWIRVGSDKSGVAVGNRIYIGGEYVHMPSVWGRTSSSGANVVIAGDGALVRSTSARKYKTNIKQDVNISDSQKLLNVPLSTWDDIAELKRTGKSDRYFGMIAEDLADAGLDYLVTKDEKDEIEGIEYARVALLLVPLVKQLQEEIKELKDREIA